MSQILFSEYFDSLYWVWLGWNQISPQQPSHCRALVLYFWSWKVTDNTPACWLSTAPTAPVLSLHHSLPYQWAGDGKDTPSMWGDTVRTAGSGWPKGYSMWYDMCSAIKVRERKRGWAFIVYEICLLEQPIQALFLWDSWTSPTAGKRRWNLLLSFAFVWGLCFSFCFIEQFLLRSMTFFPICFLPPPLPSCWGEGWQCSLLGRWCPAYHTHRHLHCE